jgi:hypothetical protein
MSRKDFLKFAGMGVLTLFGVSNFIAYFVKNQPGRTHELARTSTSHGFGSRTFGN